MAGRECVREVGDDVRSTTTWSRTGWAVCVARAGYCATQVERKNKPNSRTTSWL